MSTELTRDDVEDILIGATFFGAGGGGDLDEGLGLIDMACAAGKSFRMTSLKAVPDDALLCTPYLLGAISDLPEGDAALYDGTHPSLIAFRRLKSYLDAPVFGTIACELGGSNTAVPFYVAAMEDAVVIDADPAGRAVPEITHSTYALAGLPAAPIVAANALGETMILENIADDARAEVVVRALSKVSGNDIAAIDHALPARVIRPAIIPGTLSKARQLGKIWRAGRARPETLPVEIARAAGGIVGFQGEVVQSTRSTEGGFTLGSFEIAGQNGFAGHRFRVDLKNENMVGWLDGAPFATIPEIITLIDLESGDVLTNPHVTKGQIVSVLVLPAPDAFLTSEGLKVFGPGYAGLSVDFESALLRRN